MVVWAHDEAEVCIICPISWEEEMNSEFLSLRFIWQALHESIFMRVEMILFCPREWVDSLQELSKYTCLSHHRKAVQQVIYITT